VTSALLFADQTSDSAAGLDPVEAAQMDSGGGVSTATLYGSEDGPPNWLHNAKQRIEWMLSLPDNWDQDGASRIQPSTARDTMQFLSALPADTPRPSGLMPSRRGGIAIEWHMHSLDIELDIASLSDIHLTWEDGFDGTDLYTELGSDVLPLVEPLERLVART
jgi:hypothetical protein